MELTALIADLQPRIAALRRDLHAHPELAFQETRTAAVVAAHLEKAGIEVHRGIAGTGVVGVLKVGHAERAIGLRADMDALPLEELNSFAHRSATAGCMHACGHDGHTAMLLGAAAALAQTRSFDGTVYFIFQPAEEHEGGGRVMVEEGLFERFPMQMVFGLHNWPGLPLGHFGIIDGPVMAGADRFEIVVSGRGGHAAMPHQAVDTVLAGAALVQALQAVVSRETDPQDAAVISVTRFHAGNADNILPERAVLGGTVRCFRPELQVALEDSMRRICAGIAATYRVTVELHVERGYPPTTNSAAAAAVCRMVAQQTVAEAAVGGQVLTNLKPSMGAEDFAYLARAVSGCYVWLGAGPGNGGCMLHNPRYDFNDEAIASGLRYWVRLVEHALPRS